MNKRIKFGLVGVGVPKKERDWTASLHYSVPSIAWARYFPQIANEPRAELTAVCDIVKERLEKVKEVYNVKQTFTDYKEMLEKANIDVVIITTPNKYHFSMAIEAIKAGKHIIVEKPICLSYEEAKKMIKEANKYGVMFMPTPWRFDTCFYKIKELIDKNYIGKVCLIKGKTGSMGPGHSEWFYKSGGGVIFDTAVYPVTTITGLVGPAKKVIAFKGTAIEKRLVMNREIISEVEDNAIINLDFGDGTLGVVTSNYCTQIRYGPSLEIYGSKGAIFVENGYLKFTASQNDVQGLLTSKTPLEITFPNEPIIECFINFLLQNKDLTPYCEHQCHVIEILEKAIQSAEEEKAIKLTTTFNNRIL